MQLSLPLTLAQVDAGAAVGMDRDEDRYCMAFVEFRLQGTGRQETGKMEGPEYFLGVG